MIEVMPNSGPDDHQPLTPDARYPRKGKVFAIRAFFLVTQPVIDGYNARLAGMSYGYFRTNPAPLGRLLDAALHSSTRFADRIGLLDLFNLPHALLAVPVPSWTYLIIPALFLLLLAPCAWAALDASRETAYWLRVFQALIREYFNNRRKD